jgi:flavin-dependent dehydrogenase
VKYDLVITGGGPAGLMAAVTAAEAGLKTVLVEKKRDPASINRCCGQMFILNWASPEMYVETVKLEVGLTGARFLYPGVGLSLDYAGPLKPYTNAVWISPSGYRVDFFHDYLWGFFYDKEVFLGQLLDRARKAGAEIRTGTAALAAEDSPQGVRINTRQGERPGEILASKAILAEGMESATVESLGLNRARRTITPEVKTSWAILEGTAVDLPGHETGYLTFKMSGKQLEHAGSFTILNYTGDTKMVYSEYPRFAALPRYAAWFRNAREVKRMAFRCTIRTPLREPAMGNLILAADAASPFGTLIQGAVASGCQAARAVIKELNGEKALANYNRWWQRSFYFNEIGYYRRMLTHHGLLAAWTDAEMDYISQFFQGKGTLPTMALAINPDLIRKENPALADKTRVALDKIRSQWEPLQALFPNDSAIFPEPDACFSTLQPYLSGMRI